MVWTIYIFTTILSFFQRVNLLGYIEIKDIMIYHPQTIYSVISDNYRLLIVYQSTYYYVIFLTWQRFLGWQEIRSGIYTQNNIILIYTTSDHIFHFLIARIIKQIH